MPKSPVQTLESVLTRPGGEMEYTYATSRDFYDADPVLVTETEKEFYDQYDELVRQFTEVWGPPAFDDGRANRKFPKWDDGESLACWQKGAFAAYIALRHDDQELPFRLVYGLKKAKVPGPGGKEGKALEAEAVRLSESLRGRAVAAVRRPAKDVLVIEFRGGRFVTINVSGRGLQIDLPGDSGA
jgi:hypothetical protein